MKSAANIKNEQPIIFRGSYVLALVNCLFLILILQSNILKPLDVDAVAMAGLDPIDIISAPLDTNQIARTTIMAVSSTLFFSSVSQIIGKQDSDLHTIRKLVMVLKKTIFRGFFLATLGFGLVVLVCAIVGGAPPVENMKLTALASVYTACLAFAPIFMSCMPSGSSIERIFMRLVCGSVASEKENTVFEQMLRFSLYGVLFGVMFSMVLLTLDWGAQSQRWPVPFMLGSTFGHVTGAAIALIWEFCVKYSLNTRTSNSKKSA